MSALRCAVQIPLLALVAGLALPACLVGDGTLFDPGDDDPQTGSATPQMPDGDMSDPDFEDETEVENLPEEPYDDSAATFTLSATNNKVRVCGATALNQRSGPSIDYSVLRVLPENTELTVLETSGNWVRNDWDGDIGWSHSRYLCSTELPPSAPPPPPQASSSESVNRTNAGRLRGGIKVPSHPQWVVANTGRNAGYGTAETLAWLAVAFDQLASTDPGAAKVQIRDISVQSGGRPSGYWPHASHQSGRDVDITYPRASGCSSTTGCPAENVSTSSLDVAATWTLLEVWLTQQLAHRIFIDRSLHAALRAEATRRGHTRAELDKWFGPVIMHVNNHLNHFHVRFRCPADDTNCIN